MDRVFLDANVLFSAAYAPGNRFLQLWERKGILLLTSNYALEEARRNLSSENCLKRLDRLTANMEIVSDSFALLPPDFASNVNLPEKDKPILAAAINAKCTHLLTGDFRHFGSCFGKRIHGVRIQPPSAYLSK